MAEEKSTPDRIEAYVLREMTPEARTAFERELTADPALAEGVAEFERLREDLELLDEADFLAEMQELGNEMRTEPAAYPEARPVRRRWYIAVAAAILLLIIPAYLFLRPSPDARLFNTYFEAYPDVSSSRAGDDADFVAAMEDYRTGDFSDARIHFSDHLASSPNDQEALFYGGIAEVKAGDPEVAVERVEKLESQESIFENAAEWYRALALLKAGEREGAVELLGEIAVGEGSYRERAEVLLGEME